MNVPLEISFDIPEDPEPLEELVKERAQRLERVFDHLSSCRVAIEETHRHRNGLHRYRVRIDLTATPRQELVATTSTGRGKNLEDPFSSVNRAFDAVERQLKKLSERQRGDVKTHPAQETVGIVDTIFLDREYGFLRSEGGDEIYFHRNSVLSGGFEGMEAGTTARYVPEMGEEGLQASTVQVVGKQAGEG
jgi:ribosome-associated translation inhibitor RaiA/cold shock CspA family protein